MASEKQTVTLADGTVKELSVDDFNRVMEQSDSGSLTDRNGEVRDPRTGRIIRGGDGADDALNIQFAAEPVFNKLESYYAGTNKYSDMDFITITIPGDKLTSIHTPVTEYHKWRFPLDWDAYVKGRAAAVTGTPLAFMLSLSPSQVKELDNLGIRTVEQLANLSDTQSGAFRGFNSVKSQAASFLDAAKDAAGAARMQADLERIKRESNAEVEQLKSQMAEMLALMQAQQAEKHAAAEEAKPEPKTKK